MRLVINNFAALNAIDIQVNDLTVIIGEQASGKSLTSKVYFFLREFVSNAIREAIIDEAGIRSIQNQLKKEFFLLFPEYSWKSKEFSIFAHGILELDSSLEPDISITYTPGNNGVRFGFSNDFKRLYKRLLVSFKQMKNETDSARQGTESGKLNMMHLSLFRLYTKSIERSESSALFEEVTYIPSGRSFFSTIKDNVFGFLSENIGIDPFLKSFGRNYEFSKNINNIRGERPKPSLKEFDSISQTVIKGKFTSEKKDDWIIQGDKKISVANASSGQQEALPLILVLRQQLLGVTSSQNRTVIVEEPEAHLFPVSQRAIVNLLFLVKKEASNLKLLITTHSPYVLSCVNNGLLRSNNSVKISAYFITEGRSISISDDSSGLINGHDLDKISAEIADEFYSAMETMA